MGIPGDTYTALSRLSNRRKVKSGVEEELPPELNGASIGDIGGGELPEELPGESLPQDYDARANRIIPDPAEMEMSQQPADMYALGQNLSSMGGQVTEQPEEAYPTYGKEEAYPTYGREEAPMPPEIQPQIEQPEEAYPTYGREEVPMPPENQQQDKMPLNVLKNYFKSKPEEAPQNNYGPREDGTPKGEGYFGSMPMKDNSGKVFGELSISSNVNGEEILYPSVVPTLSKEELDYMSEGKDILDRNNPIAKSIDDKAYNFAMQRKEEGKPYFASPEEEGQTPIPTEKPTSPPSSFRFFVSPDQRKKEAEQQSMMEEKQSAAGTDLPGQQENYQQELDEAQKAPYTEMVYGATDEVMNSPELREEVEKLGIEITPEMEGATKAMEALLSGQQADEINVRGVNTKQIADMQTRIDNNKPNDSDKFLVGMALLMPLVVGGFFGAEAGFKSLAGSAKGLTDVYDRRGKDIRADEEMIAKLTKEQQESKLREGKLELEKLKIPGEVNKIFGDGEYGHLKGMDKVTYTDAEGNKKEGVQFYPGLVANLSQVPDQDAKKAMRKKADSIVGGKSIVDTLGDETRKIIKIVNQIKDPGKFETFLRRATKGYSAGLAATHGEEIMLDGRKQNAAVLLNQSLKKIGLLSRKSEDMKYSDVLFKHMESIASNPYTDFVKTKDVKDQIISLYTGARDAYRKDVGNHGFSKAALIKEFKSKDTKMFKSLNLKEDKKFAKELKKEIMTEKE